MELPICRPGGLDGCLGDPHGGWSYRYAALAGSMGVWVTRTVGGVTDMPPLRAGRSTLRAGPSYRYAALSC